MQREILVWCIAAPAIVSLVCVLVASRVSRREHSLADSFVAGITVLGWCGAIAITLMVRQQFDASAWSWSDLEAWQRIHVPLSLAALFLALTAHPTIRSHEFRWIITALACLAVAVVALPSGEGWVDLLPVHRTWMAAVAGASLINVWLLDQMARRRTERWILLVALAGLGGPTMLAASAYAGLAEWGFAAIVTTLVYAIAAACRPTPPLWYVIYPATIFAVCTTAAGRFYTYEDHPGWLYGLVLLAPSWIAIADYFLRNRSQYLRVIIAAVLAASILLMAGWFFLGESSDY